MTSADIMVHAGEMEPRIDSFRLSGTSQETITVAFRFGGPLESTTLSLIFGADRFQAFAEKVKEAAARLPGRPS
jgi:hypothetical protein